MYSEYIIYSSLGFMTLIYSWLLFHFHLPHPIAWDNPAWWSLLPSFVAWGCNSTPLAGNAFVFLLLDMFFESHLNTILLVKLCLQGDLPNRQEARKYPQHCLLCHTFDYLKLFCLSVFLKKGLCSPNWPGTHSLVNSGIPQTLLLASKMLQTKECVTLPDLFI